MRHVIMIRSCFDRKQWSRKNNRERLNTTRAVTIQTLMHQTNTNFEVAVLVHENDELLQERMDAFRALSSVKACNAVYFLFQKKTCKDKVDSAYQGYKVDWLEHLNIAGKDRLLTRLDDDDGLCLDYVETVQALPIEDRSSPKVFMFVNGYRVKRDMYDKVLHKENAMHTTYFPGSDDRHVYSYGHTKVRRVFDNVEDIKKWGWLWVRHDNTISGHTGVKYKVDREIKEAFPYVDWNFLAKG